MTSSNGNIFRVTALCAGNSPAPLNSPHKGQWRGALMFSLICVWINGWVNNIKAGDLRHNCGHYDVDVMREKWKIEMFNKRLKALIKWPRLNTLGRTLLNTLSHLSSNAWMLLQMCLYHDDVIKWKHFPRYWPFVRGIHRSPVNSPHEGSDAELWCFLWSAPEWTFE